MDERTHGQIHHAKIMIPPTSTRDENIRTAARLWLLDRDWWPETLFSSTQNRFISLVEKRSDL